MVTNPDANEQAVLRVPILISRLREAQTDDSCVTEEVGDHEKSGIGRYPTRPRPPIREFNSWIQFLHERAQVGLAL